MVKPRMLALIWKSGKFFLSSHSNAQVHAIQSYIEFKITPDSGVEDLQPWIDRVWRDASSHSVFANVARKVRMNYYNLMRDD